MSDGSGWAVTEYRTPTGHSPVVAFVEGLKDRNERETLALISALAARGNTLGEPRSKMVEPGLFELRGHQVRIFYIFLPGRRIVLLDGMIKKQDKIPAEVLERMRRYRREIEAAEGKNRRS
ncbi:MAG: type II toxin-antitoxin system RelE/ParE family toxin [Candidatus Rokubacteria bacterium]|nr:type II toxin-antitoxin system RelE/ParE family toxin [Candidatus Rokubacteria bacterium]